MAENLNSLQEYSINKKKYVHLFHALCRNSKKLENKSALKFDESLISKKINQLEQRNSSNSIGSDWISKKIHEKPNILPVKKTVVVVRHLPQVLDNKQKKKEIIELKKHILEAKKHYLLLKQKGVSKEHLETIKKKIDELEKKLK